MRGRPVDNLNLERWRAMPAVIIIQSSLCDHAKPDPSFSPLTSHSTSRWHVSAGGRDFELLCTGAKFFDTRAQKGGGGAVDLAMHLFGVGFRQAAELLRKASL